MARELAGIAQKVEQDLPQPHGIGCQHAKIVLRFHRELVLVLLRQLTRGADDLIDQRRQVHGFWVQLELAGFDLGEIEHLVDEAEQVLAGAVHALERLGGFFRAEARRVGDHHLGQADDGVERRAQLVAHAGDELRLVLARPHVLDRDRRLVREGRDQLDLLVGEWLNGAACQDQHAGRSALAQHRHAEDCAHVGEPGSYG